MKGPGQGRVELPAERVASTVAGGRLARGKGPPPCRPDMETPGKALPLAVMAVAGTSAVARHARPHDQVLVIEDRRECVHWKLDRESEGLDRDRMWAVLRRAFAASDLLAAERARLLRQRVACMGLESVARVPSPREPPPATVPAFMAVGDQGEALDVVARQIDEALDVIGSVLPGGDDCIGPEELAEAIAILDSVIGFEPAPRKASPDPDR